MSRVKKIATFVASAALAVVTAASLSACGEPVAATWAHGKIMEADITTAATNAMNTNAIDSTTGGVDADKWSKYIADREYDTDSSSSSTDSSTSADNGTDADSNDGDNSQADGTVAEYREYLIKQKLREDVIDHEIETRNIEISDDAVTSAVDSQAKIYEQYYAGGMSGTFESILNRYMGMTMDEFRDTVKENLAQDELKNQVAQEAGVSDDSSDQSADDSDSKDSKSSSKKSSKKSSKASDSSTGTSTDDAKQEAFDNYIDGLVDQADLKINDCPSDLSYDPATVAAQSSSSDDSATAESSDDSSDATDDSSTDSSDTNNSTSTDADTTKQK